MKEIHKKIEEIIKKNKVVLFMKGTPEMPQCGFSLTVCNILKQLKINFFSVNVLSDELVRQGIKEYSNWPTIPQLYVNGNFIGGCDIVKEMYEKDEIKKIIN
jgi:monothiol glutaredoxin